MSPDDVASVCWFLTGATASGKSQHGLALAKALNAEIISLDSMAIYRGMDIGTAKPTPAEQATIPHHLIDIVDPQDDFSVAQYVEAAHGKIAEIQQRGRTPLFVGGTPLYLKSLLRGIFEGPPADWALRNNIRQEVEQLSSEALHDYVAKIDPVAASAIHPHDTRRLVRAIEVYRATGQPISHQQMEFENQRAPEDCRVFVLRRERQEQLQRINRRVDEMIDRGLVDEVRRLASGGKTLGRTARQAVGYNEVMENLAGKMDHPTMVERIKVRTRQFAKRQMTWFRSLNECRFVEVAGEADPAETAARILAAGDAQP